MNSRLLDALEPQSDALEPQLRQLVGSSIKQTLPATTNQYAPDFLVESVLAELIGPGLPSVALSADEVKVKFGELIFDYFPEAVAEDLDDFAAKLAASLEHLQQQLDETDADEGVGGCAMCEREMPLTKHHLIPREHHKEFKRKGLDPIQLNTAILICRPCHSAIHRTLDNKQLALQYNSLEKLMEIEALQKFTAWARKQRTVKGQDVLTNPNFRYRR